MIYQKTIAESAAVSGIGLHTGAEQTVTFHPAPADHGILFRRTDLPGSPAIPADARYIVDVSRGTTIGIDEVRCHTIEHAMSVIAGLGISNLLIEMDGPEMPIGDGSALHILEAFQHAGITEQDVPEKVLTVREPIQFQQDAVTLSIEPAGDLALSMTIDYNHFLIGLQTVTFTVTPDTFAREIAPARTFCLIHEVQLQRDQGLIRGGSLDCAIVVGEEGVINGELRFPDEFARHKLLDLLGDTRMAGGPLHGRITAARSGHATNAQFTKAIQQHLDREY